MNMSIKNVVLDFGHGGLDANGRYTTYPSKMAFMSGGRVAYEGVLNRQIGGLVEHLLKSHHPELNVKTTVAADDPRDISLRYRVRVANQYNPRETVFISIHSNAFNGLARGFELYTTRGRTNADYLAESIARRVETLYRKINLKLRYDFRDGDRDKEVDFYVLRKTRCPAVLLECLFFDNEKDFDHLNDPEFQTKLALAIYKGILDYIK